jgi:hypothetical protein
MQMKILFFVALFSSLSLFAEEESQLRSTGEVALELRKFKDESNSASQDQGMALFSRLEMSYEGDTWKTLARGFARIDQYDRDRNITAVEEAFAEKIFSFMEGTAYAGFRLFSWSAMEAFTAGDIVNSKNFDSDLERLEKKGELTVALEGKIWEGRLGLYLWPRFERPMYPGDRSRLGVGLDLDKPHYLEDGQVYRDPWALQYGGRYEATLDDWDFSLFTVYHLDRRFPTVGNSEFITGASAVVACGQVACPTDGTMNNPYHSFALESGGNISYVWGNWIFKVEAVNRDFDNKGQILTLGGIVGPIDHQEAAVGGEYVHTFASGLETTFYLEANSFFSTTKTERAQLWSFQRDLFFATRFNFNDADSKEITLSTIADLERSNEHFYSASYSQRLNNEIKIKTGVRVYDAPKKGSLPVGMELLDGDNQLYVTLSRFF